MMDFRRKTLVILGAAAFVSVALSGLVLYQRARQGTPQFTPTEFLPGFAANVKNATSIHIVGSAGAFDVVFSEGKGWLLPDRGNYPADFDEVRHTLIGLATLETLGPKTARPDWLRYLGLETPPKGPGVSIIVKDAKGAVLADLIAGNMQPLGYPGGTSGLFVRRPGENQTWLARAVFVPHGNITAWLKAQVLDIGAARLEEVAVTPASGPAFTVSRPSPGIQVYNLLNPPKSGTPNSQFVNVIPYAVTNFSIVDVKPAASVDFSKSSRVIARTFEGLLVTFDLTEQGEDVWAKLTASTAPGASPQTVKEAQDINTRNAGWAFKLPTDKGRALTSDLARVMTAAPAASPFEGMSAQDLQGLAARGITP